MEQLIELVDGIIIFLLISMLLVILLRILPNTYRFYLRNTEQEPTSGFRYISDGSFWSWLFSREGKMAIFKDAKEQRALYYNNFKLFNWIWRFSVILITFRVLVIFFGPEF